MGLVAGHGALFSFHVEPAALTWKKNMKNPTD
jgi:hypothetical protein